MPQRKPPELPKLEPWKPPHYEIEDAGAIQALLRGDASPHQQQRALTYIIEALCGAYDMSYRPSSDRDTYFARGKRAIGIHIDRSRMHALQAVREGKANAGQQLCVLDYIIAIAGTYDELFLDSNQDFAEGKRFVGNQLVKLSKINLSKMTGKTSEQG